MLEWLQEKHRLIILAILISLLLWFYVNNQTNNLTVFFNNTNKSFLLNLELKNLPDDYEIKNLSNDKVVIKLDNVPFFYKYNKGDFSAYIDLSDIHEGENINVIKVKTPPNVNIKEIDPEFIKTVINKKVGE